jgi:hypothetical protein
MIGSQLRRWGIALLAAGVSLPGGCAAQSLVPDAKPIPRTQAIPLPGDQISFQRNEKEIARYYFSPTFRRPFIYPVIGPSGRTLTRMGHPGDPYTHSHHNSIWISHSNVNGVDFFSDHNQRNPGRIIWDRTESLEDGQDRASAITVANWTAQDGRVLLRETRQVLVTLLPKDEWMLIVDLALKAENEDVTFGGGDAFGLFSVRVAKQLAAYFGGGRIRNSEGAEGEPAIFRKPARWVDHSGMVAAGVPEGLTLFDHPMNPNHPSRFHVREDGWMSALLAKDKPVMVPKGQTLRLRYGVYVHAGVSSAQQLNQHFSQFVETPMKPAYGPPKTERDCLHGQHRWFTIPRTFSSTQDCWEYIRTGK